MASKGRPQTQTDHNRTVQRDHKLLHIFHSEQNIVCAVCRFFVRDPIIFPEILFCRAKLDCYNLAIRRSAGKQAALSQAASRRDARHCGSMSNFIFFRHQAVRIFQLQRPVDLLPDVFRSIEKTFRRLSALIRLIPNRKNPAAAVRIAKYRVFIRNPGIDKRHHYPAPRQLQRRPLLRQNPGAFQRFCPKRLTSRCRKCAETKQLWKVAIQVIDRRKRQHRRPIQIINSQSSIHLLITEGFVLPIRFLRHIVQQNTHIIFRKNFFPTVHLSPLDTEFSPCALRILYQHMRSIADMFL